MKVSENIKKLIQGTLNGKIKWEKVNPVTYNWMTTASTGEDINVIIQNKRKSVEPDMLFRLWNLKGKFSIIDINYRDTDAETKILLEDLWKAVSGSVPFVDDIFSDILKDI